MKNKDMLIIGALGIGAVYFLSQQKKATSAVATPAVSTTQAAKAATPTPAQQLTNAIMQSPVAQALTSDASTSLQQAGGALQSMLSMFGITGQAPTVTSQQAVVVASMRAAGFNAAQALQMAGLPANGVTSQALINALMQTGITEMMAKSMLRIA